MVGWLFSAMHWLVPEWIFHIGIQFGDGIDGVVFFCVWREFWFASGLFLQLIDWFDFDIVFLIVEVGRSIYLIFFFAGFLYFCISIALGLF